MKELLLQYNGKIIFGIFSFEINQIVDI